MTNETPQRKQAPWQADDCGESEHKAYCTPEILWSDATNCPPKGVDDYERGIEGLHEKGGNCVCKDKSAWQDFVGSFQSIGHLFDGTCIERILPTLAQPVSIKRTFTRLSIELGELVAGEWRMPEPQPLGPILDDSGRRAHPDKRRAAADEKFVIVARPEQSRLNTDEVPDICRLLRLVTIDPNRSSSHLVRKHERANKAREHERVDAGCIPSFAKQGLGSDQHCDTALLEDRCD